MSDERFALIFRMSTVAAIIATVVLLVVVYVRQDTLNHDLAKQAAVRAQHTKLICPAINRLNRDVGYAPLPCTQITKEDKP